MTNVTCGLTAKKPGSAPSQTLVNQVWDYFNVLLQNVRQCDWSSRVDPGGHAPPETFHEFFTVQKHISEQIGQLLRLCKCKKSFQLQGAAPWLPNQELCPGPR